MGERKRLLPWALVTRSKTSRSNYGARRDALLPQPGVLLGKCREMRKGHKVQTGPSSFSSCCCKCKCNPRPTHGPTSHVFLCSMSLKTEDVPGPAWVSFAFARAPSSGGYSVDFGYRKWFAGGYYMPYNSGLIHTSLPSDLLTSNPAITEPSPPRSAQAPLPRLFMLFT